MAILLKKKKKKNVLIEWGIRALTNPCDEQLAYGLDVDIACSNRTRHTVLCISGRCVNTICTRG